jgi:hypothetical protein
VGISLLGAHRRKYFGGALDGLDIRTWAMFETLSPWEDIWLLGRYSFGIYKHRDDDGDTLQDS